MVLSSASAADEFSELSAKTGIEVGRLQELNYIGKQTGTSLETITGANAKLIRSMASAETGTGDAAAAFKRLEVDVTDGTGALRNSQDVFNESITKLAGISNETERDALSMALFGKSAQELNPLIKTSAEDLASMAEEANAFGAVMSDEAINGLASFNDLLDGLKLGLQGTLGELSAAFLPGFQGAANTLGGYLKSLVSIIKGSNGDLRGMASGIGGLLGTIVTDIAGKGPEMLQGGLGIVQGIMDAVIGNLPVMLPGVIAMIQSLIGFIVQNLPMLIDAAVQILLMLVNSLITMLPMLLVAAIQIIVQLANGLTSALPTLIPAVVGIILELVTTLIENLPMLIDAALQLILALAQGLIAALPVLIEQIPTIILAIVNGLIEALPSLLVAAVQIILSLGLGIIENIPLLLDMIPQVIDALVTEFKSDEFKEKMKSMGEEIVNGIGEGFKNTWESFKENFIGSWNDLVTDVKDLLGIQSPSTVFSGVASNIVKGSQHGFTSSLPGLRQQVSNALQGINASTSLVANVNLNGNTPQVVEANGKTYQLFFETYNEAALNRTLRQTEMLYGA